MVTRQTETFGYSAEQLESNKVYLVGARAAGRLVGVGGVELQDAGIGELKRFFVLPEYRRTGVADALITALVKYATDEGTNVLRLETGDKQQPAIAFYRRHGFVAVPCFGPYVQSTTSLCMERRCKPRELKPEGLRATSSLRLRPGLTHIPRLIHIPLEQEHPDQI